MNLVLVSLAAVAVIFHPVLTQQTLPMTVLQGDGDTCPSDQEREGARQNITTTVRTMIQVSQGSVLQPGCGEGAWKQVASLDMSDPSQQCPSPWREYTATPGRLCGRPEGSTGCASVTFSVNGFQYNKVCGRAIGYQDKTPDPIQPDRTIDEVYVDGLSLTHGSPRNHIWTFISTHTTSYCPCASDRFPTPSFVGDNYFCDGGVPDGSNPDFLFYNEPLWDGDCLHDNQCCTFNTPPWFSVQLPTTTSDDIEVRICGDEGTSNEDTPIELLEIYVQ